MKPTLLILAALLGMWAYSPVVSASWVMEDSAWWMLQDPLPLRFRSLTMWTWQWTATPQAAHLVSVGLHGVVALLAGLYAWRLGLSSTAAWVTSAFVLVNPSAVEAVAYAASRSELLAAIGVLGACLAATIRAWWKWPIIVAALCVGLLGKESAIAGLALVPLTLWMTHQPWKFIAVGATGLAWCIAVSYDNGLLGVINQGDYAVEVGWVSWLLVQSTATFRMLSTLVTGVGMTPDFDYDRVPMAARVMSIGWLVGFGALALYCRTHARMVTFTMGWLLITIAPRLIVQTPTSYFNEHQFYTPRIGVLMGLAVLVVESGRLAALGWGAVRSA